MSTVPHDSTLAAVREVAAQEVRLARIEEDIRKLRPQQKDGWEILQILSPLVAGVGVAIVGYVLTGSVTNALERQRFQLANATGMQQLLTTLTTGNVREAEAAAYTLSAFGPPAVPALMAALLTGSEVQAPAAEAALRVIGLTEPASVCGLAQKVLDNRRGRVTWMAHMSAIRLLGDLDCRSARGSVQRYARALSAIKSAADLSAFAETVDASIVSLDSQSIEDLTAAAKRTLAALGP